MSSSFLARLHLSLLLLLLLLIAGRLAGMPFCCACAWAVTLPPSPLTSFVYCLLPCCASHSTPCCSLRHTLCRTHRCPVPVAAPPGALGQTTSAVAPDLACCLLLRRTLCLCCTRRFPGPVAAPEGAAAGGEHAPAGSIRCEWWWAGGGRWRGGNGGCCSGCNCCLLRSCSRPGRAARLGCIRMSCLCGGGGQHGVCCSPASAGSTWLGCSWSPAWRRFCRLPTTAALDAAVAAAAAAAALAPTPSHLWMLQAAPCLS